MWYDTNFTKSPGKAEKILSISRDLVSDHHDDVDMSD